MAAFSALRYFIVLLFLNFYLRVVVADPEMSFSFENFSKDSNFESQIALYGDAKVVNGGMSIELCGSMVSSAGRFMLKNPLKLVEGNPRKMVSFSVHFVFSLSSENGDGLAFVMVPSGFPLDVFDGGSFGLLGNERIRFLGVEFDTFRDEKYGDLNDNHVGVDVSSLISVKVGNASSINLMLNSGEKLQSWIDYEASSKRLEVRLGKLGEIKPLNPLLSCPIDLSQMWKENEVFVGLSSSSGNSSQNSSLYSWSFKTRTVPHWMHSQPLDPLASKEKIEQVNAQKRGRCALRDIAAFVLGTASGALLASVVLFLCTIFSKRRPVVPEDYAVQCKESEFKDFKVVVEKVTGDGKK